MDVPFFGKVARVDLTTKKVSVEPIDRSIFFKIIGGKGLGAYLLLKYLAPGINPLSAENIIILANGPLTGSGFPGSSRVALITKSPLTGTFLDTNAGGYLGRELKATGLDAIRDKRSLAG
jgi:aldehyde:ferredoxin oxidoreductase